MSHRLLSLGLTPLGRTYRPTHDRYIDAVEQRWQLQLPTQYRFFLATYGVCVFADPVVLRLPDGSWVDVHTFLGNDPDDSYDLSQSAQRLHEVIVEPWLPFATDPAGNMFCFDLHRRRAASVRYVGADGQAAVEVADSFDAFIHRLRRCAPLGTGSKPGGPMRPCGRHQRL